MIYTVKARTLLDRSLCSLFGGCLLLKGYPFFASKPYSVWYFDATGCMSYYASFIYCDDLYKHILQIHVHVNKWTLRSHWEKYSSSIACRALGFLRGTI